MTYKNYLNAKSALTYHEFDFNTATILDKESNLEKIISNTSR